MILVLTTPPSGEPVTYADFCTHSRTVSSSGDETYFNVLNAAIRYDVEQYTRRSLFHQTWTMYLEDWPEDDYIELPYSPLSGVASFRYWDSDGTSASVASGTYSVDTSSTPGKIVLGYGECWPMVVLQPTLPIEITFVSGYGTAASAVPAAIRQAILIGVSDLWENRESLIVGHSYQRLDTVQRLLAPHRVYSF